VRCDTFYFSALASVLQHFFTRTFDVLKCWPSTPLLRDSLCSIHRRIPKRLLGTPCRTEHRNESWAIPFACRATPSATSEHLVELLAHRQSLGPCRFLRFLSTEAPSLHQSYPASSVLRAPPHPKRPAVSRELPVDPYRDHRGTSRCAWSLCLHAVAIPGRSDGFVRSYDSLASAFPRYRGGFGSCVNGFEACSAFTHVTPARSPSRLCDPLPPEASAVSLPPLLL